MPSVFFCQYCRKGFHFQAEMDRHVGVHSTTSPFPCSVCDKGFSLKKSLRRHEELHNDKKYLCSVCGRSFDSKDRRYSHYRGAHGKGYTTYCGITYQWPGGRDRHQKNYCDFCKEKRKQRLAKNKKFKTMVKMETGEQ